MTAALRCENVRSGYDRIEVLSGVTIEIKAADIYALVGKNGAGKTTLLQTILGVLRPTVGSIKLFGNEIVGRGTYEIVSGGVTCAPQEKAFFNELSVGENLRLGSLSLGEADFARGRDRVAEMFPVIAERWRQKAGTLSGGEQAMVKVARALLAKPKLVLLDEVTEGLQPLVVERVQTALKRDHAERGTTFLIVEQNVDFVAGFAHRYGVMERGEIREEGHFSDSGSISKINEYLTI